MVARPEPRTSLSLCGGILGLDMGVRMVLPSIRLVGVVERQAHAAAIVVARMAEGAVDSAPVFDDLTTFDGRAWSGCVDLVVAGIPCQGNSLAGRRAGVDDERWLWGEVWRIVCETGARYLFIENVPGLLTAPGDPLGEVLGTLAASGWAAEWDHVPAATVGAPHLRDRFFLLAADTSRVGLRVESERDQREGRGERATERGATAPELGGANGYASDADDEAGESRRGQGRTDARRGREHDGRASADTGGAGPQRDGADGTTTHGDSATRHARNAPNSDGERLQGERGSGQLDEGERSKRGRDADRRRGAEDRHADPHAGLSDRCRARLADIVESGRAHWDWSRAPVPVLRNVDDGSAAGLAGLESAPEWGHERYLVDGKPVGHGDELHALGNAVVPYASAYAFTVLWDRLIGDL